MNLLELKNVSVSYGQSIISQDLSFYLVEGETLCIMGRNGVGKTTTLKAIMGIVPVTAGEVWFNGRNISKLRPHEIARLGIGYVPQGRMIYPTLTVEENLMSGIISIVRGKPSIPTEIFEWFPVLENKFKQVGGTLSGGEQQQLAIARCLASNPKLVLLDEPSEGIQPNIVQSIIDILIQINREKGVSILLIEQNVNFCISCGTRGYVMEAGRIEESGSMDQITSSQLVQQHLTFKVP